jgi:2-polyprenyl-3-methyl-5-hydroxy-6-metoxy-1,4-benzoquinol methylase
VEPEATPAPPKNTVESFYDWMVEVYDPPMTRRHFLEDDRYHNVIAQVAAGPAKQMILDTACGNGWLASLYGGGHEVVAIDIADANLRRIEALGMRAVKHDLEQPLPFADAMFDTVVCSEILEHLFRPDLLLREVMRVLKPGGRVIVTVPNLHGLRNRIDLLVGKRTPFIEFRIYQDRTDQLSHVGVQHIRHYSFAGMRSVLQTVGFEQVRSRGQSFHLNASWPFTLLSLLHGGNRGLRVVLRVLTFGRWVPEYPGLELRLRVIRALAWLMPRLSPGMLFVATRPSRQAAVPGGQSAP